MDYNVKNEGSRSVFPRIRPYKHFFELGGIYTFLHFGTFENGENRQNLDLRSALLCFFMMGKIAEIRAVVIVVPDVSQPI